MQHKQIIISVLLSFGVLAGLQAQQGTNAAGGNASGSGGSISYSVGQIVSRTYTGTDGSAINEGVQQPFEIFEITAVKNSKINLVLASAYPNPVSDYLKLSINMENLKGLSFHLYDIQGKLLKIQNITSNETQINMTDCIQSMYLLKVMQNDKELKTFRIIKN